MEGSGKATGSSSSTTSSSSSGTTIVSAAYTSSPSQLPSMSLEFGEHECREETERRIISMVQEFFGVPSASFNGGDMSVVEGWLRELGVGWVLYVAGASAVDLEHAAGVWIRAFTQIMETIHSTASLFPDRDSLGLASISEEDQEDEEPDAESCIPDQFQFVQFIQEAMLKMLAFVDAIVAPPPNHPNTTGQQAVGSRGGVLASCDKLHALLDVHGALAKALSQLRLPSPAPDASRHYSAQVVRVHGEMASLLSAKEGEVGEAIWSTMEEVRTTHLESTWDPWDAGAQTRRGSSGIHRITLSTMSYIKFLLANYSSVAPIVCEAARLCKYEPRIGIGYGVGVPPLSSLIVEMASCLEEKLTNKPESFPDESLRFLFLLNNSYFIWQQVLPIWSFLDFNVSSPAEVMSFMELKVESITRVEGYMESYLQVSWASVLSCLFNPMPPFYRRLKASPLTKFESAFRKTYAAQKLCKVPDPELRRRLRKAITEKIMPGYTKFIEDNNVTTPKFIPHELEGMLQELFEG